MKILCWSRFYIEVTPWNVLKFKLTDCARLFLPWSLEKHKLPYIPMLFVNKNPVHSVSLKFYASQGFISHWSLFFHPFRGYYFSIQSGSITFGWVEVYTSRLAKDFIDCISKNRQSWSWSEVGRRLEICVASMKPST